MINLNVWKSQTFKIQFSIHAQKLILVYFQICKEYDRSDSLLLTMKKLCSSFVWSLPIKRKLSVRSHSLQSETHQKYFPSSGFPVFGFALIFYCPYTPTPHYQSIRAITKYIQNCLHLGRQTLRALVLSLPLVFQSSRLAVSAPG